MKLGYYHLPYLVMHLDNLQDLDILYPIVERFREVVIDVLYLGMIIKFTSTPQVGMILI
jgi:hypothetical protein